MNVGYFIHMWIMLSAPLQVEDRVPVRSWGNSCAPIDGWQSLGPDERLVGNVEVDVERKWVHAVFTMFWVCRT